MSKSKTLTSNAAPEIRSIFSSNLRQLCDNYGPISQLSSELGINRTQFNRYLSGNSFPRPDVLFRICNFFGLDARILLEPLDSLQVRCSNIMFHSDLEEFFHSATDLASQSLPTGFINSSVEALSMTICLLVDYLRFIRRTDVLLFAGSNPSKFLSNRACPAAETEGNSEGFS